MRRVGPTPPKNLKTPANPTRQRLAPLLLKIRLSGQEIEGSRGYGPRVGRVRGAGERRLAQRRGDRGRWREDGAKRGGGPRRANPRAARGGFGPLPHLAALLVMKADHHDVQYGPPRGASTAPPGLLHGRRPRFRTTISTAKGGRRGDPAVSRRTASGGFQMSAREPHEGPAGRPERTQAPGPPRRPPGPMAAFPSAASAASGLSPGALPSPAGGAGQDGEGPGAWSEGRGRSSDGGGRGRRGHWCRDGAGPGWAWVGLPPPVGLPPRWASPPCAPYTCCLGAPPCTPHACSLYPALPVRSQPAFACFALTSSLKTPPLPSFFLSFSSFF